ncbi:YihY family inner membrane protein [Thiotrichales bacterium 19S3-7]|nr:YihY family inner membrane protein [Thiotrichales bacterium 19S3-7]MCF6800605.1 YihY family inner membrane protein [Thiotrichales bacterium 19S3-11]
MQKQQQNIQPIFKRIIRFWGWVLRQFVDSNSMARAASLTLTSLLAMVPFLIMMMTLASLIPDYGQLGQKMQNFIFNNFAPHTGEVVGQYIDQLVSNRIGLPLAVTLALFIISIFMIRSIDQAVNAIWQVEHKRNFINAFLLYWAIITLGPILFGLGLGLSSYLLSLKWVNDWTLQGAAKLFLILPSLFYFVAFIFLYRVIPFVKVKMLHAVLGALVAVILFETVKYGFTLYVTMVPTYELIYGALVAIPLFILWVLIAWYIFLLGAIVVKGLHLSQAQRSVYKMQAFSIAMSIIKHVYQASQIQKIASFSDFLKLMPNVSVDDLKRVLNRLVAKRMIYQDGENYILCCNLDKIYFDELYAALSLYLPIDQKDNQLVQPINQSLKMLLHQPIAKIIDLQRVD